MQMCHLGVDVFVIISHSSRKPALTMQVAGKSVLLISSCLPCLGMGVISAVFYTSGNVEDKREPLMIDVMKGGVINRLSVRTRVCILSITGALLEGIAFMTSATCLQST